MQAAGTSRELGLIVPCMQAPDLWKRHLSGSVILRVRLAPCPAATAEATVDTFQAMAVRRRAAEPFSALSGQVGTATNH